MRTRWLIAFFLSISLGVLAQSKPAPEPAPMAPLAAGQSPATAASPGDQARVQSVPDNAPVVTINGVCEKKGSSATSPTAASADCKIQITKAEFENMLNAIMPIPAGSPALPAAMKRERATQMAQLLVVATTAENNGVQNTPEAQELLKIARMQALAQVYARQLQQKSKPTEADVQAYYNANLGKYDQATFNQLFIPRSKSADGKPVDEAADKARAEKFRERAAAGEPFEKLEREAIEGSAFKTPPPTEAVLQQESLPPNRQSIFNLKPGELSQVIPESSGFLVYKMQSKSPVPFAQVKPQIEQRLAQERFQSAIESVLKSGTPVFNDAYFGSPAAQAGPGTLTPVTPPAATTAKPAPAPQKPTPTPPAHK